MKHKGFYESSKEKEPVTERFLNVLDKINAYDNVALSDEEADRISDYMGLSFVRNSLYQYKNFIEFLKTRVIKERFEATLLSESSLAKDWLKPEEDKAWKDL